ncbi:acyl-CoA thioesterase [Marinospirillum perlucidum]|uniref:acyl-CoA thioesterase n=1 Tax=Marinospirillum perlucidum TaxID=1982602 RepID=UPI000DF2E63F|nr:acyl-CoA thioesterase [Marinospirillum perlucidum]
MARVSLEFPEKVVFRSRQLLRISDINYGQHLGHDTLISLLHEARCHWLASEGLSELSLDGGQVGWVVGELVVNYQGEAFYPDELTIELAGGDRGSKSIEIYHRVLRSDGTPVALAKTGLVCFDYASRQAAQVPARLLELLDKD